MNQHVVSAVFDNPVEAERALREWRSANISESAISLVGPFDENPASTDSEREGHTRGSIAASIAGAGVAGAILGVAALAIPGVGPLAATGAIAASAVPTAAGIGAAAGATGGAIGKMLTDHDVHAKDAEYFEEHIQNGGVFLSVVTQSEGEGETALELLYLCGGHNASKPKASAM